jgi:hypothetical protein
MNLTKTEQELGKFHIDKVHGKGDPRPAFACFASGVGGLCREVKGHRGPHKFTVPEDNGGQS